MSIHTKIRWVLGLMAGAAVLATAAGCQDRAARHGEQFLDESEVRDVHAIEDAQSARGARADATLHADHFTGNQLNTLGQDRLDLMLHDDDANLPMVVYLDVPQDDQLAAREQSVTTFLKDRGMREDQVKFEMGPNPKSTTPAVPSIPPTEQSDHQQSGGTPGGVMPPAAGGGNVNPTNH